MILGIHQSSNQLKAGDRIISNQQNFVASYFKLWEIYNEAAVELGFVFPKTYGYAYPVDSGEIGYSVGTEYCIRGHTQKSLYYIMSFGLNYFVKDVARDMPIEERTVLRKQRIKSVALEYFQPKQDERIELISEDWIVL